MSVISDSSQEASNIGFSSIPVSVSSQVFNVQLGPSISLTPNLPPGLKQVASSTELKRRSSSRSIKRKKFDDELVESSLVKSSRARPSTGGLLPILPPLQSSSASTSSNSPNISNSPHAESFSIMIPDKRKVSARPQPKRIKKPKSNQAHVQKTIGRWKPTDDLSLILSIQQTNDLEAVYRGVKFSSKFTLQEIQERWYSLLYDPAVSKVAVAAMKQLNSDVVSQIQAKVLFSDEEEKLIASIPSTKGNLDVFQELLEAHASTFLPSRTANVLYIHWSLMKQYNLLPDQIVQENLPKEIVLNFSDAEDLLDDDQLLKEPVDVALNEELAASDRTIKREIRTLENELQKWQVVVDCITGVSPPEFDTKTLAILKGRIVRYLMQAREITIGRSCNNTTVDIDLSLEGPAWKISRRQGVIKLDNNGDFFLINEGRRPFFVDGKPVLSGSKFKLVNNSVLEIIGLRFVFLVNHEMITALKTKGNT